MGQNGSSEKPSAAMAKVRLKRARAFSRDITTEISTSWRSEKCLRRVAWSSSVDHSRRTSHGNRESKNRLFLFVKMRTSFELREVVQLLCGDSGFSAHGRMNINSKWAAHHQRGFELRKFFQLQRNRTVRSAYRSMRIACRKSLGSNARTRMPRDTWPILCFANQNRMRVTKSA